MSGYSSFNIYLVTLFITHLMLKISGETDTSEVSLGNGKWRCNYLIWIKFRVCPGAVQNILSIWASTKHHAK